jgi:hypothetical protein
MDAHYRRLTDFLREMGVDQVNHTHKSYLAHLIGVYRDLQAWGCDEEVSRAGMFHSIYGTERFRGFALPLDRRNEVRELIGERAERLAYANCAMDRSSFDRALLQMTDTYHVLDRITQRDLPLERRDFDDLCRIHVADWLEQVPRSQDWNYRREAYRRAAARLGGVAQQSYERVFVLPVARVS